MKEGPNFKPRGGTHPLRLTKRNAGREFQNPNLRVRKSQFGTQVGGRALVCDTRQPPLHARDPRETHFKIQRNFYNSNGTSQTQRNLNGRSAVFNGAADAEHLDVAEVAAGITSGSNSELDFATCRDVSPRRPDDGSHEFVRCARCESRTPSIVFESVRAREMNK